MTKNFGTIDLTQGYHQTPLEMITRAYTSFITREMERISLLATIWLETSSILLSRSHANDSVGRLDLRDL
jgi:hypothetical protein